MNGFVIVSGLRYLDRHKKWRRKLANEAYVFSQEETNDILAEAKIAGWKKELPEFVIPAIYHQLKDYTEITGKIPAYPDTKQE
jgi:hypothetical protein